MTEAISDSLSLQVNRDLYYGGGWHKPLGDSYLDISSPSTGASLGRVASAGAADVDAIVSAARQGYLEWRRFPPLERAKLLKQVAALIRANGPELAYLDALDGGNPVSEMLHDASIAAAQLEFFAGLVTEMKGTSVPIGPEYINCSVREPLGVVVRIVPFNHPFMFVAGKMAAPLAAGNSVIMKPPEQAPLSSLRLAELCHGLLPPGVLNIIPGGREIGSALSSHKGVSMVALVGSVPTGRAVMRNAAETVKPVLLELGGKNALIAFPDCDPDEIAGAVVRGMNFTWCGQSCGSTSRAFVHDSIYDRVVNALPKYLEHFKPGIPTEPTTTMGAIISEAQYNRVLDFIERTHEEGGKLIYGGRKPAGDKLSKGFFLEPTVFEVTSDMTIAKEEIFGPVLALLRWRDESEMLGQVNDVEYGLTCSIWTNDLSAAYRTALAVEAGYIWINDGSKHFLGTPFGGSKQSGIGREECLGELLSFSQEKNIHLKIKPKGS